MKTMPCKKIVFIISFLLLCVHNWAGTIFAAGYPHASSYNIECSSCHFTHNGLPGMIPPGMDNPSATIDDTQYNNLCRSCHKTGGEASGNYAVVTHSSLSTDDSRGTPIGYEWSVQCIVCHDTHVYEQAESHTALADYYFEGTITSVNSLAGIIEIGGAGWTVDQFAGHVAFPDKQQLLDGVPAKRYKIVSNTSTWLTVDPRETLDTSVVQAGKTLVITRSKLVRSVIDYRQTGYDIFSSQGRYIYSIDLPEGINLEKIKFQKGVLSGIEDREDAPLYHRFKIESPPDIFQ